MLAVRSITIVCCLLSAAALVMHGHWARAGGDGRGAGGLGGSAEGGAVAEGAGSAPPLLLPAAASADGSAAWDGAVGLTAEGAPSLAQLQHHPFCKWQRSGASNVNNELAWGTMGDLCRRDHVARFVPMARALCFSCATGGRVCGADVPKIPYHVYVDRVHPVMWNRSLALVYSYLMTQDLDRSHLTVWTHDMSVVRNANTSAFLDYWSAAGAITLRVFDHAAEVKGTPLEEHPLFADPVKLKRVMFTPATYTDVLRLIILHNYGGLWVDYDILFLQDLTHFLAVSYQLSLRWVNNPFMYYHARSPLIARLLRLAAAMPADHPDFQEEIIDKRCKPVGYAQSDAPLYKFNDIYNTCLLRLGLKVNNTLGIHVGPEGLLVDVPLAWFDDWSNCYRAREPVDDNEWRSVAGTFLTLHSHFFKSAVPPAGSPLSRYTATVDAWFAGCNTTWCMPRGGAGILAFDGAALPPHAAAAARPTSVQRRPAARGPLSARSS